MCAQAMCLEEMVGCVVDVGVLWFASARRRVEVALGPGLRQAVVHSVAEIRATLQSGRLPAAVDDERCTECQLLDVCLPSTTSRNGHVQVEAYVHEEVMRCSS